MNATRSDFTYELRGPLVLIIEHDTEGSCSVANDAENVIAELVADGLDLEGRRIIYRDACGSWDELQHRDGHFVGFNILNASTPERATLRLGLPPRHPGHPAPDPA